jgi:hypothetical protein
MTMCVLSKRWILLVCVVGLFTPDAAAQDGANQENDDRLKQAAAHMDRCQMRLAEEPNRVVSRSSQPLLTYGDSARQNKNGTLWAFGVEGRPLAFLELYQGNQKTPLWVHAVTLTGERRVTLATPASGEWRPGSTQIEPTPVPVAPAPEDRPAARLRQMKEIARRFTAHEFWDPDNSRFELRLLVQPVHRYKEEAASILDGAAFVLAHGTNPEVILLIEAHGAQPDQSQWRYSLARLGSAELHVELDGREVWKRERTLGVVGQPGDPYWLFFSQVASEGATP